MAVSLSVSSKQMSMIMRCNKSITFSDTGMSPDEAKHRIMQWCLDGTRIPNRPGGKQRHMNEIKPRLYRREDLRPVAQLEALANAA